MSSRGVYCVLAEECQTFENNKKENNSKKKRRELLNVFVSIKHEVVYFRRLTLPNKILV